MTIRLFVADDHILIRQGIVRLLNAEPDIEVIGKASDGIEALAQAHETHPEIVLMDISMPGLDGLAATRLFTEEPPDVKVIIFTASGNPADLVEATKSGARGYVVKRTPVAQLIEQIRRVAAGGVGFSDEMMAQLVAGVTSIPQPLQPPANASPLSHRERDVLDLIAQGQGNKDIAEALGISQNTVRAHMRTLFQKLRVDNRTQLALYGLREGLGKEPTAARTR